jgi:replicative DNA helicase
MPATVLVAHRPTAIEQCGGAAYVSRLTSSIPTSANVEHYARIVLGASIRRMLDSASKEITARAYDNSAETNIIVKEAETKIFEISDRNQTRTYFPAKEIVKQTFEAIEKHYHSKTEYTGIPSGFRELDQLTMGFQNSEFIDRSVNNGYTGLKKEC